MKLIELELSFEGFSRRSKLPEKLEKLISRDWGPDAEAVATQRGRRSTSRNLEEREKSLQKRYADLGKVNSDAA